MNTKVLCVAIVLLTVIIFGANQYAAQKPKDRPDCHSCECTVKVISVLGETNVKLPSCSVVFWPYVRTSERNKSIPERLRDLQKFQLYGKGSEYLLSPSKELYSCVWSVYCDPTYLARVECKGNNQQMWDVNPAEKCTFRCTKNDWEHPCEHWVRPSPTPTPTPTPPPKKKSRPGLLDTRLSMFFTRNETYDSFIANLLPAKYSPQPIDNNEERNIISRSIQWRPNGAEAGIEKGILTVASGEAEARSFCTGDSIRLAGPGTLTLPLCDVDVSGNWWGAYARRVEDYESEPVTVTLSLRKEAASLRGELITSDGVFDVVSISRTDFGLDLQASRAVAGKQQKIVLRGTITKGEIVFGGSEQSLSDNKTFRLTGVLKRVYVADNALPPAAVNQPYSFALVALSPTGNPVSFRLTNPAPKQPEQITWTTEAEPLRGRNGERFTYLCPANGTPGRLYSRDNAYTDTSSICTAAVNAHVINQQAGGVVTIEIRPGPSPDTGRFVFVSGEPQGGIRGRLPQGLSFDSQSGTFSGTPTELGSFDITIVADDGAGSVFEQPLTLTVKKLVVTNRLLPDAFVGQPYAATLKVAGGQPPYRFSGNVPNGLQLDPITGALSGRPSSSIARGTFEVTVRDSQNNSESQRVSLTVRGTTIMNSYFLPDAEVGVPYRTQFQAVGNASPVGWSIDPDASGLGLALNPQTGELTGTPTKAGNGVIRVQAQGGNGVHSRRFGLTIKEKGTRPARSTAAVLTTGLYTLGLLRVPVAVGFVVYRTRRRRPLRLA